MGDGSGVSSVVYQSGTGPGQRQVSCATYRARWRHDDRRQRGDKGAPGGRDIRAVDRTARETAHVMAQPPEAAARWVS